MKIENIHHYCNRQALFFDNGCEILTDTSYETFHVNFADFEQLDKTAFEAEFDPNIKFESGDNGFKFGNDEKMFFVPCYSLDSDLLTPNPYIDIYWHGGNYNTKRVIKCQPCKLIKDD